MMELLLGADHSIRSGRLVTLQAPGGSGSLRVGAELYGVLDLKQSYGWGFQLGPIVSPFRQC